MFEQQLTGARQYKAALQELSYRFVHLVGETVGIPVHTEICLSFRSTKPHTTVEDGEHDVPNACLLRCRHIFLQPSRLLMPCTVAKVFLCTGAWHWAHMPCSSLFHGLETANTIGIELPMYVVINTYLGRLGVVSGAASEGTVKGDTHPAKASSMPSQLLYWTIR